MAGPAGTRPRRRAGRSRRGRSWGWRWPWVHSVTAPRGRIDVCFIHRAERLLQRIRWVPVDEGIARTAGEFGGPVKTYPSDDGKAAFASLERGEDLLDGLNRAVAELG